MLMARTQSIEPIKIVPELDMHVVKAVLAEKEYFLVEILAVVADEDRHHWA